ncbi:MAG: sigma-70 family RNA polymerase sigma factor [Candidatus Latescibacterota bacterium]
MPRLDPALALQHHAEMVGGVARRYASDPEDVRDLVQQTFLRALVRLDSLRQPEQVRCWPATTARRVALSWLRRRRVERAARGRVGSHWLSQPERPDERVEREERVALVQAAVQLLRMPERQAIQMYLVHARRQRAAARPRVPASTLTARLWRARRCAGPRTAGGAPARRRRRRGWAGRCCALLSRPSAPGDRSACPAHPRRCGLAGVQRS